MFDLTLAISRFLPGDNNDFHNNNKKSSIPLLGAYPDCPVELSQDDSIKKIFEQIGRALSQLEEERNQLDKTKRQFEIEKQRTQKEFEIEKHRTKKEFGKVHSVIEGELDQKKNGPICPISVNNKILQLLKLFTSPKFLLRFWAAVPVGDEVM